MDLLSVAEPMIVELFSNCKVAKLSWLRLSASKPWQQMTLQHHIKGGHQVQQAHDLHLMMAA